MGRLMGQRKEAGAEKVLLPFFDEVGMPGEKRFDARLQPIVAEAAAMLIRIYEGPQPQKAAEWRKRLPK